MRCGRAVWPPGPCIDTLIRSAPAVIGPERNPSRPTSILGSQCNAKTRCRPSISPSASTSRDPPGVSSSAGWKISRTERCRRSWRRSSERTRAVPSSAAVCASWPQAWQIPARCDRYGTSLTSCSGSASMSARKPRAGCSPVVPSTSQMTPVPLDSTRGSRPAALSRSPIAAVVTCSSWPSSGWRWRRRRNSMSSASKLFASASISSLAAGGSILLVSHPRGRASRRRSAPVPSPQNASGGVYTPHTSRRASHTSPTVARAASAAFMGTSTFAVPSAADLRASR